MEPEAIANKMGLESKKHKNEDKMTSTVEHATARLPSIGFLIAGAGCVVGSAILYAAGRKQAALFVGHWVPSILLLGVYNKIVKETELIEGSESSLGMGSRAGAVS